MRLIAEGIPSGRSFFLFVGSFSSATRYVVWRMWRMAGETSPLAMMVKNLARVAVSTKQCSSFIVARLCKLASLMKMSRESR